ncbi:MAG: hypothetical protein ACOY99_08325 [Pseudomonadota bacterium]
MKRLRTGRLASPALAFLAVAAVIICGCVGGAATAGFGMLPALPAWATPQQASHHLTSPERSQCRDRPGGCHHCASAKTLTAEANGMTPIDGCWAKAYIAAPASSANAHGLWPFFVSSLATPPPWTGPRTLFHLDILLLI